MAPGRDELIAANAARINAAVNSPSKETGNVAGATSSAGAQSYSAPRSRMGGNLDVVSALDSIVFQGKDGDASMRGNVAYIRRWKRGNTAQQAGPGGAAGGSKELQEAAAYSNVFGPQSKLSQDISAVFSPEAQKIAEQIPFINDSVDFASQYVSENSKFQVEGGFSKGLQTFTPGDFNRLQSLSFSVPTTKPAPGAVQGANSSAVVVPGPDSTTTEQSTVNTPTSEPTGKLKSANPNGFLNILGNVGKSVLGIPPSPPIYAGDVNSLGKAAPLPEGMWQFLFNPSELELEAGPEFKTAETWGVSDKANSGQPLHWSHNKNATLKFNSVLLNGFVFGRKVEALEQGLLELFMARDGDGQDGPHVLEFVWGKRVFGPCVIKNVSVKEKQWDEGEVVNAELSFTLEQVPEWTINDGFVDVARPGRQPTVAAPEAPTTTGTGTNDPAVDPGPTGTGDSPDQKAKNPQSQTPTQVDFKKCRSIQSDVDAAMEVSKSIRSSIVGNTSALIFGTGFAQSFQTGLAKYNSLLTKYRNSPVYKPFFAKYIVGKCLTPTGNVYGISADHAKEYKLANTPQKKTEVDNKYKSILSRCAGGVGEVIKRAYTEGGCNRFQSNPSSTIERL